MRVGASARLTAVWVAILLVPVRLAVGQEDPDNLSHLLKVTRSSLRLRRGATS